MNWKITISILFLLTITVSSVYAQDAPHADFEKLKKLYPVSNTKEVIQTEMDWSNEIKLLLTMGFNIYKKYVSSQDALNCAFYPSCSSYALETVQSNGFIGLFDAIDRLTRCNGFSPEKYETHENSSRFYDPVKKIH